MAGGTDILRSLARVVPARAVRGLSRPVAFHFHGVERLIQDSRIQRNHLALDDFYRMARALKAEFQVLPLSALDDVLKYPERHPRAAFLMSDDGYRNTLDIAADVLDGLALPWTLFVSTHHIDSGELNPATAARLFCYFAPVGLHPIPHFSRPVELGNARTRERAARKTLTALRSLDLQKCREAVQAMLDAIPAEQLADLRERFQSERFLNWPQVAALAARRVEIGAHAHHHWPMHRARPAAELAFEARISKARIENQIGPCRYFAYPFGNVADVSRDAWRAVRDAGFTHAFATLAGSLDGGLNPWLLPRYELKAGDARLGALVPLLRAANPRLARWQRELA